MITLLLRYCVLLLGLASALWATPPHHELAYVPSTLTREFVDSDGLKLTVKWTGLSATVSGTKSEARYLCEIIRDPSSNAGLMLSLINLGLQGRDWDVEVVSASGKNLGLYDDNGALLKNTSGSVMTKVTGVGKPVNVRVAPAQQNPGGPFESKRLCFLQFEGGSCRMEVTSYRKLRRPMKPEKSEHDSVPPPPEPGGDDGSR